MGKNRGTRKQKAQGAPARVLPAPKSTTADVPKSVETGPTPHLDWKWRRIEVWIQIAGLVVATVLGVVYWAQLRSMEEAVRQTRISNRATTRSLKESAEANRLTKETLRMAKDAQRPLLVLNKLSAAKDDPQSSFLIVKADFINLGGSPAFNAKVSFQCAEGYLNPMSGRIEPIGPEILLALDASLWPNVGAGQVRTREVAAVAPMNFSDAGTLHCFGRALYFDGNGETRLTEFAMKYLGPRKEPDPRYLDRPRSFPMIPTERDGDSEFTPVGGARFNYTR